MSGAADNREWRLGVGVWAEKRRNAAPAHAIALEIEKRRREVENRKLTRACAAWFTVCVVFLVQGPFWLDLALFGMCLSFIAYWAVQESREQKAFRARRDELLDAYEKETATHGRP